MKIQTCSGSTTVSTSMSGRSTQPASFSPRGSISLPWAAVGTKAAGSLPVRRCRAGQLSMRSGRLRQARRVGDRMVCSATLRRLPKWQHGSVVGSEGGPIVDGGLDVTHWSGRHWDIVPPSGMKLALQRVLCRHLPQWPCRGQRAGPLVGLAKQNTQATLLSRLTRRAAPAQQSTFRYSRTGGLRKWQSKRFTKMTRGRHSWPA